MCEKYVEKSILQFSCFYLMNYHIMSLWICKLRSVSRIQGLIEWCVAGSGDKILSMRLPSWKNADVVIRHRLYKIGSAEFLFQDSLYLLKFETFLNKDVKLCRVVNCGVIICEKCLYKIGLYIACMSRYLVHLWALNPCTWNHQIHARIRYNLSLVVISFPLHM